MHDYAKPCDCKGNAVDRPRKRKRAKAPTPLSEFEQIRDQALGAQDRGSYIMADSMAKNRVSL